MERINGEAIAGAALALLGGIFIFASMLNSAWQAATLVAYLLIAVGAALIVLGRYTTMKTNRSGSHEEHSHY